MIAVAALVASGSTFAQTITMGQIFDACSARLIAIAMKDRYQAEHPQQQGSVIPGAPGPGAIVSGGMQGSASAQILRISTMGGRQYGVVRDETGEVEDMAVGQSGDNGLVISQTAANTYELMNAKGQVVSTFTAGQNNAGQQGGAGGGSSNGPFLYAPPPTGTRSAAMSSSQSPPMQLNPGGTP